MNRITTKTLEDKCEEINARNGWDLKHPLKSFCEMMVRKHEAAMLCLMKRYRMDGERCGEDIRFCNHLRDADIWNHRGGAY